MHQCHCDYFQTSFESGHDSEAPLEDELITDEEKNEYYANKTVYLNERLHRRELLKQRFQNFKLNSSCFKIRPRNVS